MPEPVSLSVERNVAIPMRDGTTLYGDVYRPAGPGPYPALLTRTPYDKAVRGATPFVLRAATAGYAVVVQDVRGRFTSEGDFQAFVNERQDGYDTIDWLAGQPWCNGNVGMFGGSYVGMTQWQAALSGHEALKAIVPYVTASNYHDGWAYQGGAFQLQFNYSWALSVLCVDAVVRATGRLSEAHEGLLAAVDDMTAGFGVLPHDSNAFLRDYMPSYQTWLDHPTYDEFWEALDVEKGYERIQAAALNFGGWHDIFQKGTLENFKGARARGGSEAARDSRLIIGPWNHGGMVNGNPIGSYDFGSFSTGAYLDSDGLHLAWYDRWLRGQESAFDDQPPARVFVMGAGRWRNLDAWPVPQAEQQEWFFHSAGSANSLRGNGTLNREPPSSEPPDSYVYNPLNPVPTCGGGLCCNNVFSLGGAYDQRGVEEREDVLVYTSEPLEAPLEVTGPITVTLYASSSALDTDFTAKLVDVAPCGYARNLTDGILRARYRESMSDPSPITPGEVIRYEIDLWSTSNEFQPGHRIRVEISSSNFPRFDRNPNTGELPGRTTEMASALQTVHHSTEYPSRIVLPVIPEGA